MIVYLIFPCYLCQNLFIHSGNLTTHKQSYSVENPLTCSICLNSFTHHGKFTAHRHFFKSFQNAGFMEIFSLNINFGLKSIPMLSLSKYIYSLR